MRSVLRLLPLLATATAIAQSTAPTPSPHPACPVRFVATDFGLEGERDLLAIGDSGIFQPRIYAKSATVHVYLGTPANKRMLSAELAVSYRDPNDIYLFQHARQTRTFRLTAINGADRDLDAHLLVDGNASITAVHILAIRYADGTQWLPPGASSCTLAIPGDLFTRDRSTPLASSTRYISTLPPTPTQPYLLPNPH